jgi:hypothetical protein
MKIEDLDPQDRLEVEYAKLALRGMRMVKMIGQIEKISKYDGVHLCVPEEVVRRLQEAARDFINNV